MRDRHDQAAPLYDADFVRWTQKQAGALRDAARAGVNAAVDWENVAEEVESLGQRERRELASRLGTILEHLLKLKCSPAREPRTGWVERIDRERDEAERVLSASPSLRGEVCAVIAQEAPRAARRATRTLELHGETSLAVQTQLRSAAYSEEQVLGDWLPGPAYEP